MWDIFEATNKKCKKFLFSICIYHLFVLQLKQNKTKKAVKLSSSSLALQHSEDCIPRGNTMNQKSYNKVSQGQCGTVCVVVV